MNKRKHPPISVHPTLHGNLEINWEQDYDGSFHCPKCNSDRLWFIQRANRSKCKLYVRCKDCEKDTYSVDGQVFGWRDCAPRTQHTNRQAQK